MHTRLTYTYGSATITGGCDSSCKLFSMIFANTLYQMLDKKGLDIAIAKLISMVPQSSWTCIEWVFLLTDPLGQRHLNMSALRADCVQQM